ncbi:hypothetical protein SmJEL517_g05460 [Synchytrium microbalum]|uniref:Sulfatase N-terminal domain-containing protein n=1 Tax=Synchytrium microbalum TaxID=1806994 RepID=A0A507C0P6_9FUNG|nr:uncharacterized protein SmJEL517_g05460 [Synchytrium microbalum]TPX31145.1 hypothetical protein SmJEL517_g05460 [Synchytrium microbalum]
MTGYHTASACSPTRSGTDSHLAGLGQMEEFMMTNSSFRGKPGYEGYLNFKVAALSEILSDNGYLTMMSGKWHLGLTIDTSPWARGFENTRSFSLLPGNGNHFGFEPQLGHERPEGAIPTPFYTQDNQFVGLDDLPRPFYSTKTFTDKLLGFFKDRNPNEERPFFAYLPFTAPHWPLQAPEDIIAKYRGRYDNGPDALRAERLEKLKKLGLIPQDVVPHPILNVLNSKSWENMSHEEQLVSARAMEIYASMVDMIDQNVGRVLDYLRHTGELDNTFILFMSDNGAEGQIMEAFPTMGIDVMAVIRKYYNQTYENMGRKDSFVTYGPRWAQCATAPSRMYKTWTTEGGIRVPCIINYAKFKQPALHVTEEFSTCMDVLPSILELAGIQHPAPVFRGRDVYAPRGRSMIPHLSGLAPKIHDEEAVHGWELFGLRAIRRGDWKAVWIPRRNAQWELYNLKTDPAEIVNLASKEKDILNTMIDHWTRYSEETGAITFERVTNPKVKI